MPFRTPVVSVIKLHGVIAAKSARTPGQDKINYESVKPLVDKAFKPKNLKASLQMKDYALLASLPVHVLLLLLPWLLPALRGCWVLAHSDRS